MVCVECNLYSFKEIFITFCKTGVNTVNYDVIISVKGPCTNVSYMVHAWYCYLYDSLSVFLLKIQGVSIDVLTTYYRDISAKPAMKTINL